MRERVFAFALACFAALPACPTAGAVGRSTTERAGAAVQSPANAVAVAESANRFGLRVFGAVAAKPGNVFVSPASLATALDMAYAGARGRTASEMSTVLSLPADSPGLRADFGAFLKDVAGAGSAPGASVSIANSVWLQAGYPLLPSYRDALTNDLRAYATNVDFADGAKTASAINEWVREKTNGAIAELVGPASLPSSTRLFLANAVAFHGVWVRPFDRKRTKMEVFNTANSTVGADFMHLSASLPYAETPAFQVVELAYAGPVVMDVVVPRTDADRTAVESALADGSLVAKLSGLRPRDVNLALPRFRVSTSLSLADTLARMGMPAAFDATADFSGITDHEPVAITSVAHRVFVEVDEEGTVAGAATGIGIGPLAYHPPVEMRADRPFLVVIRTVGSGAVLFVGRVADPTAE
jgi:serpin B